MTSTALDQRPQQLTTVQWLICAIACIGFAFDSYVLLMLPLVLPPALQELGGLKLGSPEFAHWRDLFFYLPAVCGGLFGLLGGYLADLFGRRRVLVWSILVYAVSALAAAVAWLAELFPSPRQRERVLGYTQAISSVGGFMVSGAFVLAAKWGSSLPAIHGAHEAWRYTLISGVIPAIPLMIIRPFLPESPTWKQKKLEGTLKRPSIAAIFKPELSKTTLVSTLMVAASFAVAFGAIQQLTQIVPGLPGVRDLPRPQQQEVTGTVQLIQELGGLTGRFILALLVAQILSRRKLLRIFQIPGLILVPLVFIFPATSSLVLLKAGIFVAGLLTVAQFSFWGNYLPRVFPTHLRGTGESFAANVGGRMIGTSAALLTTQFAGAMPGATPSVHLAYAAAAVAFLAYAIGLIASFWLPEPERQELPE